MFETELPTVQIGDTVRDAMAAIGRGGCHIAIIVDDTRRVLGVVSDGDIRRAILNGIDTDTGVASIMNREPLCAQLDETEDALRSRMEKHVITAMPVVDKEGRLADIRSIHEFVGQGANFDNAVIFAGGEGRRLRPLTESMPKPMVPIGGRPLIEISIARLARDGVGRVHVAVNYMADMIRSHLRDGSDLGTSISYLEETTQLGTAGALALMKDVPDGPILVMNGDILSTFNAAGLFHFHRTSGAAMTIGVVDYHLQIPFGVVETAEGKVRRINEKPNHRIHINAGVYAIDSSLLDLIPREERYDMTDLISAIIKEGKSVIPFLIHEHWIDIGTPGDLERAEKLAKTFSQEPITDAE
jgi:dTDP-glucose pyrophosphorylase